MTQETQPISPYRRGADNGIVMGLWISLSCGLLSQMVYGTHRSAMFALFGFGLCLLVPVLTLLMLMRTWRADDRRTPMAMLWTEGIMTFVFGAIIAVVAGYVFMRFIEPDFLHTMYSWMLDSMKLAASQATGAQAADYTNLAHNFETLMDRGELPGPMPLLLNTVWFIIFSGSVLSAILAGILTLARRLRPTKNLD